MLFDLPPDSISRTCVSGGRTGANGSRYLRKSRHRIIEEMLISFAEVAFAGRAAVVQTNPIFHTTAATDGKVRADKALVAKILLGPRKGPLFTADGKFLYRRFQDVAQSPFRFYKKLTG